METNPWNLANLFRNPFGPDHPRNRGIFGPSEKNRVPFTPKEYMTWGPIGPLSPPTEPKPTVIDKAMEKLEELNEMKRQKEKELKETMCQCGKKLKPIVVEVSFKLKNPEVTYVGDIFLEYCPDCQDEQFLALACKNASHKFLTNLTQNK